MKLIITQPEIESIVREHVENTVQLREGAEMEINFTATRSDDGITATIEIPYLGLSGIPAIADQVEALTVPAPTKTRMKPGPKPKAPEPEAPSPQETAQDAAQDAAGDSPVVEAPEAPEETAVAPSDAQAASSRGPSLFSSFRSN